MSERLPNSINFGLGEAKDGKPVGYFSIRPDEDGVKLVLVIFNQEEYAPDIVLT
jgi:hypothetical protein